MIKHKLPENWIVRNSKSHPDRVYYFNVKTKQSSWVQPTLDESKTPSVTKHHKQECCNTITSEHNANEKKMFNQRTYDKIIETPQKIVKKKALQKLNTKNKASLLLEALENTARNNTKLSSINFSSKLKVNKSVTSWDKNDNQALLQIHGKLEQRSSNIFSLNKISKEDAKTKKQSQNTVDQKSMKTWEKRDKNIRHQESITRNRYNIEQHNKNQNVQESCDQNSREKEESFLKKNLAQERMQRMRKNLNVDVEKIKEMCNSDLIGKKAYQKLSRSLSNSNLRSSVYKNVDVEKVKEMCNADLVSKKASQKLSSLSNSNSLGSRVYKNVDTRLKRLHNRILKAAEYERNITSKGDKLQTQQSNKSDIKNMTKDKLIEQGKQEVLYEEMDWEPMKDEEIALQVEVVRTQLCRENRTDETNCISENAAKLMQPNDTESHDKGSLYIVVDTNVLLSNLEIIKEARDASFKNYLRPFIVIPWTVICELDYFKDAKHELSMKARKAISFIHEQFSSKHPRVIGQTGQQAIKNKEDFSLDCPDDEILQCCLQISQLQKSVVLLSYDKNLCTKAMIYNILTLERYDSLGKIDDLNTDGAVVNHLNNDSVEKSIFNDELYLTDDIFEEIKFIMNNFLSTIITKQMSEIYGETEWKTYVIVKPPWTVTTALKCAIKHWIAAINESFQRRAQYVLNELFDAFKHISVSGQKLRDVEYIIEKSSDLVQMINVDKYSELMTQTFNAITELKKKCKKYFANIDLKKLHDKIGTAENSQEQEMRAEKVFQCFQYIYNYSRDLCGLACSNAGMAYSFAFKSPDPPLSQTHVQRLQSEITKKVIDLTQNLNKLLVQAENSIKHQTLLSLQQNLNTFLPDMERIIFDITPLDVYCCIRLKEEVLKTGLRQLQELTSHFCALAVHT